MQLVALTQETAFRTSSPKLSGGLGLGTNDQADPFQASTNVCTEFVLPTAMQ
jgi:hypothetical protein